MASVVRRWFSVWLARAWVYGYNTRRYDDRLGIQTSNPYDGTYPEESDE